MKQVSQQESSESPEVPVSWGELIDKITILEIKVARLKRRDAVQNVQVELSLLLSRAGSDVLERGDVQDLKRELTTINGILWEIEDRIRDEEALGRFGAEFIELARSVYKRNDERAGVKRRINELLRSKLIEEKSYSDY